MSLESEIALNQLLWRWRVGIAERERDKALAELSMGRVPNHEKVEAIDAALKALDAES